MREVSILLRCYPDDSDAVDIDGCMLPACPEFFDFIRTGRAIYAAAHAATPVSMRASLSSITLHTGWGDYFRTYATEQPFAGFEQDDVQHMIDTGTTTFGIKGIKAYGIAVVEGDLSACGTMHEAAGARTEGDRFHFGDEAFWLRARERHSDYGIETQDVPYAFLDALEQRMREECPFASESDPEVNRELHP